MDSDPKVIDLRRKQKIAVRNVDFELAESLDRQIAACKSYDTDEEYAAIVAQFKLRTDEIVEGSRRAVDNLMAIKAIKEREIRIRTNSHFESIQGEHLKALVNFERDCAAARLRETARVIPEQEALLRQARNAGASHLYSEARQFREAADFVAQADIESRLTRIESEFESMRQSLLKRQREEVELLSQRLDAELKNLDDRMRLRVEKEDEVRGTKLIGHFEKQVREFGNTSANAESLGMLQAFEREFASHLLELNCPIPKGIATSSRTRPTHKNNTAKIR